MCHDDDETASVLMPHAGYCTFNQGILCLPVPTMAGGGQIHPLPRAKQKFVMEMLDTVIQYTS